MKRSMSSAIDVSSSKRSNSTEQAASEDDFDRLNNICTTRNFTNKELNYKKTTVTGQVHRQKPCFTSIIYENLLSSEERLDTIQLNFFEIVSHDIFKIIRLKLKDHGIVRVNVNCMTKHVKAFDDGTDNYSYEDCGDLIFTGIKAVEIDSSEKSLHNFYTGLLEKIAVKLEGDRGRSGLHFIQVTSIQFGIVPVSLLGGSGFIELPKTIIDKKACINFNPKDDTDNKCFLYAVWIGMECLKLNELEKQSLANAASIDHNKIIQNFACKRQHLKKLVLTYCSDVKFIRIRKIHQNITKLQDNGIVYPVTLNQVEKFELMNNIRINIFSFMTSKSSQTSHNQEVDDQLATTAESCEDGQPWFYTIYRSNIIPSEHIKTINLLCYSEETSKKLSDKKDFNSSSNNIFDPVSEKYHFCYIKDLSRLVGTQKSKFTNKHLVCESCLTFHHNSEALTRHLKYCFKHDNVRVEVPEKAEVIKFKNVRAINFVKFVIYADIECMSVDYNELDSNSSSTRRKDKLHVPYSIGMYLKSRCGSDDALGDVLSPLVNRYISFRSLKCIKDFFDTLEFYGKHFAKYLNTFFELKMTDEDLESFQNAKQCYICKGSFDLQAVRIGLRKVRDHDHFNGSYIGASHSSCNLLRSRAFYIPIAMHNLCNYDANFLLKEIKDFEINYRDTFWKITVIPNSSEKFISFSIYFKYFQNLNGSFIAIEFRFIDTLKFLSGSLDKLGSLLTSNEKLTIGTRWGDDQRKFDLLSKKATFWYDLINSEDELNKERDGIPEIQFLFNSLTNQSCKVEEYERASEIWKLFECKTWGDYSDLYMELDVLLLTDIFENFRSGCMKEYSLDPCHFYTLPGYSFEVMLKYTEVEIPLISDIDIHLFFEKQLRGGICQVNIRKEEFNNKYLKSFDSSKPVNYGFYLDAVNLYGSAMQSYLPISEPQWVLDENNDGFATMFSSHNIMQISNTSDIGYVFEVDLDYPQEIHDSHSDLPFCCEQETPPGSKIKKLLCTLNSKKEYVIHYRNLKQCIENGLKITKIHRVVKFKQSPWLKRYIDLNTKLRANADNVFMKNLFKLMNNSCYGKFVERTRNRLTIKLTTRWENVHRSKGSVSFVRHPLYRWFTVINENLVMIALQTPVIKLNKPIYIGTSILDLSKVTMYDFHYNHIKKMLGDNCKIIYMDTDSFIYTSTKDLYMLIKDSDWFDTSNYPINNRFGIMCKNKQVLGKMKDELAGRVMKRIYALKPKIYMVKSEKDDEGKESNEIIEMKKIKGLAKSGADQVIEQNYIDFITSTYSRQSTEFASQQAPIQQKTIQSFNHSVFTITSEKNIFRGIDDKRVSHPNLEYHTLPYGHYKLRGN